MGAVNIRTMAELEAADRMTDAGRAVFDARKDPGSPGYKAQKKAGTLDETRLGEFKRNEAAWAFFQAQPPGYRKEAAWWVMQAKREETRDRRLATLIELFGRREAAWRKTPCPACSTSKATDPANPGNQTMTGKLTLHAVAAETNCSCWPERMRASSTRSARSRRRF